MAAGDLVTGDWQLEYDEFLFGDGTDINVVSVDGLDQPDLVTADRPRLRRHGTLPGDDFLVDREITIDVEVHGDTEAAFETALGNLAEATRPGRDELPLVFQIPGVAGGAKVYVNARPRRRNLPINLDYLYRLPRGTLQFVATDPRIYTAAQSLVLPLPSGGGGLTWPAVWPAVWSAQTDSGNGTVTNSGNFPSPWTARIDGPVTNPIIRNVTTGQFLGFDLTVASGDYLGISSELRAAFLNGTASRYYTIQAGSQWWEFQPGNTEVAFRASTTTGAQLTVTHQSAWIS